MEFDEAGGVQNPPGQPVPDADGRLLERLLVVAVLERKDKPKRTDIRSGDIAQHQLDLEAAATMSDFEVGLFRRYHPHVIFVRELADAADVRCDDRIVRNVGRRRVKDDHEQSGVSRGDLVDQLLAVAFYRQLRVERQAHHRSKQEKRGARHWLTSFRL